METKTAKIKVLEAGIVKMDLNKDAILSEDAAMENFIACKKITNGQKYVCLVDARVQTKMTKEGDDFLHSGVVCESRLASAYIVKSKMEVFVNNIKASFQNEKSPTRLFTTENEAVQWLRNHYDKFVKANHIEDVNSFASKN